MSSARERAEGYITRGFYPVRWAHHPPEIKAAIRAAHFRPLLKQCYRNCQLLMVYNDLLGLCLDLTYHEGWVLSVIPIEHAWLEYQGEVLELTLDDRKRVEYLQSTAYTLRDIRRNFSLTKTFSAVTSPRRFGELHPWRAEVEALWAKR